MQLDAMAARIASNTENPSSSGGSPTAFERNTVGSTFWFSKSFTFIAAGISLTDGIL